MKSLAIALLLISVAQGTANAAADAEDASDTKTPVSAWVKTIALDRANEPRRIQAYGVVYPGRIVTLSWAHPGIVTEMRTLAGKTVKKGDVLAVLHSDPQSMASYQQAVTAVAVARAELGRTDQLLSQHLATLSQRDAARKALGDATTALQALTDTGAGSSVQTLVAPFDGVVASVAVNAGDRPAAGAPILDLGSADTVRVEIAMSAEDRALLTVGDRVELRVAGQASMQRPAASAQGINAPPLIAQIANAAGQLDPKSGQLNVEVFVRPDASHRLIPGQGVSAIVLLGNVAGYRVPRDAVLADDTGAFVYQVASGKAKRVEVTVETEHGTEDLVTGQLDPKLPLVVLGNYELSDGMAVRQGQP